METGYRPRTTAKGVGTGSPAERNSRPKRGTLASRARRGAVTTRENRGALVRTRRSPRWKVELAFVLRKQAGAPYRWIAKKLQMGRSDGVCLLHVTEGAVVLTCNRQTPLDRAVGSCLFFSLFLFAFLLLHEGGPGRFAIGTRVIPAGRFHRGIPLIPQGLQFPRFRRILFGQVDLFPGIAG